MANYNFENIHILVVDDNEHMRVIVTSILKSFGARYVYEAEDGSDALQLMGYKPIDIVITDWVMEPLDGYDFIKVIRTSADSPNPYVPIIMLTAYTEEYRVTGSRDVGVTEFIMKPISAKALLARLITIIDEPRPFVNVPTYTGPDRRRHRNCTYAGEERRQSELQRNPQKSQKNLDKKEDLSEDDVKQVVKI